MPSIKPVGGWQPHPQYSQLQGGAQAPVQAQVQQQAQQWPTPVYVHDPAVGYRYNQSFVNDLRNMGGREMAGLTFGAAAGVLGGMSAVRTAFGLLKFLILLSVFWLLFLPVSVSRLMDGDPTVISIWLLAGTPIWLTAVFALNRSSIQSAIVCFALSSILSVASVTAYVKLASSESRHIKSERAIVTADSVSDVATEPVPTTTMPENEPVDSAKPNQQESSNPLIEQLHQDEKNSSSWTDTTSTTSTSRNR
jgi:hypothetical protein